MRGNKPWRDAATLIIAAARNEAQKRSSSAKGIISARYTGKDGYLEKETQDHDILMLQRSSGSSFMANKHVFPGGTLDEADLSEEWFSIFETAGFSRAHLGCFPCAGGPRPPLYKDYINRSLIPDIAFRICAIRETFEEVGLLLVRQNDKLSQVPLERTLTASVSSILGENEVLQWRTKVHDDAFGFLELCRQLKCAPDIWSLYEWSEWLTPVMIKKRFDAIFYITSLSKRPIITSDNTESSQVYWATSDSLFKGHIKGTHSLGQPQVIETGRLSRFNDMKALQSFYATREKSGIIRIVPTPRPCKDGFVMIFPGDDMYAGGDGHEIGVNADENGMYTYIDSTLEDLLSESDDSTLKLNRGLFTTKQRPLAFLSNVEFCGHAVQTFIHHDEFKKSKL